MTPGKTTSPQGPSETVSARDAGPMVVGIGASAGGLSTLKTLFQNVPGDSELAFVVVVHLSPEHKSHLADLLQPHVRIPVTQVSESTRLEPNHVYVIPPGRNLSAIDTHLRLSELEARRQERAPIDHFFRTLASVHDGHAVGIILSGTGSDGTLGIRDIKARGGLTIVQDPNDAEFDGMPQSAISSGMVDLVLPVSEIASAILKFAGTQPRVPLPSDGEKFEGDERQLLQKVFGQLRARTGRDFSRYKPSTTMRRIARRMQLNQIEDFALYVEKLRQQPEEVRALSDDLLITVTNFFRDTEVFEKLEKEIIPKIFDNKSASGSVRMWSVGCATGEEAYSLAMLLIEESSRREAAPQIQVFASDLHERSLAKARDGVYPAEIEADVSTERLKRFFQKQGGSYRIRKEVRDLVVFAPHNLLADPPFSRIDLISCRNLLIYLQRDVQRDVIELFHYALGPNGYLILGSSETIESPGLFHIDDKTYRVYRKRNVPGPEPRLPVFPVNRPHVEGEGGSGDYPNLVIAYGALHQRMIEHYVPASVLVNPEGKVVHLSEQAGNYFVHTGGEPTMNVFKLVRKELRTELRALLHAAQSSGKVERSKPIPVELGREHRQVVLHVYPAVDPPQEGFSLVVFEDLNKRSDSGLEPGAVDAPQDSQSSARISELQAELELTRQRLQGFLEEHESSREEMKASNEELQSTNEELRSTLEELETSKEELQSMNEELQTVNQENRHKVEELALLSGDLQNLLTATDIATLFLDRELRILRFTPKVSDLFNMRSTDRGRLISDLTHKLGYDQMKADAGDVLDRLIPIEREVQDASGHWYLTRVLPYRSSEDRIDGVVITFVDISAQKQSEAALRDAQSQLATELTVMTQLHELISRLLICPNLKAALDEVLAATIEIVGADMGNVQQLDPQNSTLKIAAQRGFEKGFLDYFQTVKVEDVLEGKEFLGGIKRVIVEDVQTDDSYKHHRDIALTAGYRALQSTPLLSFNGRILGVLSTFWKEPHRPSERELRTLDLYCRQAAEFIERTGNEEELRDADKKKDEFLAILAHELRNPLAPLRNAAEILRRPTISESEHAHTTEMIQRQVTQLAHLVDDLLEVSRISLGKITLRKDTVNLASIVDQAIDVVQPICDAKTQKLNVSVPKDLFLEADPVRLSQIIGNLLTNASKFSKSGSEIWLTAEREGGENNRVAIKVRDAGKGIVPNQMNRIFEMFTQVDTSMERSEGGLGIGLTLVKRLVDLHNGKVDVMSEGYGKGSEFVVHLPAIVKSKEETAESNSDTAPSTNGHRRILVVDDNRDSADTLVTLLRMSGHTVSVAYDGLEAVERASQFQPDLVILDLGLPKLDGYHAARRIRELSPNRKMTIVALSGWSQSEDRRRSREAGFDAHLVKPVNFTDLETLLGA